MVIAFLAKSSSFACSLLGNLHSTGSIIMVLYIKRNTHLSQFSGFGFSNHNISIATAAMSQSFHQAKYYLGG